MFHTFRVMFLITPEHSGILVKNPMDFRKYIPLEIEVFPGKQETIEMALLINLSEYTLCNCPQAPVSVWRTWYGNKKATRHSFYWKLTGHLITHSYKGLGIRRVYP